MTHESEPQFEEGHVYAYVSVTQLTLVVWTRDANGIWSAPDREATVDDAYMREHLKLPAEPDDWFYFGPSRPLEELWRMWACWRHGHDPVTDTSSLGGTWIRCRRCGVVEYLGGFRGGEGNTS